MRNVLVFMLAGLGALTYLTSCAMTASAPVKTQLQIRQLQTRVFETPDDKAVLKAMVNVLQDDGYMIKDTNTELGILSAVKEYEEKLSFWAKLDAATSSAERRGELVKSSVVEVSANISKHGEKCRVRANFQIKTIKRDGTTKKVHQIVDEQHYTEFFAKVHKGIFLDVDQGL